MKIFVLVCIGMVLLFLAEDCVGECTMCSAWGRGGTEDLLKKEVIFDWFASSSIFLYFSLYGSVASFTSVINLRHLPTKYSASKKVHMYSNARRGSFLKFGT